MLEQVKDHSGRDTSSHNFKHCVVADHQFVSCDDLRIVGRNYYKDKQKQKIEEALSIKNLKPSLNVQEKSVALKLFNYFPWKLQNVAMTPSNFEILISNFAHMFITLEDGFWNVNPKY